MRERVVVVLGAGDMRCAPLVTASLAVWAPDDLVEVRLFDANEERLDLVDRLLREAMDRANTEHRAKATPDSAEALEGATEVILTLDEDCARRMRGQTPPSLYVPVEPGLQADQVRGDPNKPTHPDLLSRQTHTILSSPSETGGSREEALKAALSELEPKVPSCARVLDLTGGEQAAFGGRTLDRWDWPPALPAGDLPFVPHRILRWIQGEGSYNAVLEEARSGPLVAWLSVR